MNIPILERHDESETKEDNCSQVRGDRSSICEASLCTAHDWGDNR